MEKEHFLISEVSPSLTLAAEVIIECSISLKNCSIYQPNHKIVLRSVERTLKKIQSALNLKFDLKYHFAKNTIIYEQTYLDKKNPIFSRFASSLWEIGIISLEFKDGINEKELLDFFYLINKKEEGAFKSSFPHIILEFFDVGKILVEKREEILEKDKKISEKLWEEFVFSLSEKKEKIIETKSISQSVVHLAKKMTEEAKEKEKDYGSAVVDYLKKIDSDYRTKGILSKTDLGNKIKTFIENLDPSLRQQILVSCLTSEELSPNILQELFKSSNINLIMEALSKLNAESRDIPLTVYRTITLLSMLEGEEKGEGELDDISVQGISEDKLQTLLDNLLSDDQMLEYSSEEYEEKIEKLQIYADEMAKREKGLSAKTLFSQTNINTHFLGISLEILNLSKNDSNLPEGICQKLNDVFLYFFKTRQYGGCMKCIALKKKAEVFDPKVSALNYLWEEEDKIEYFIELLKSEDKSDAIIAEKILSQIGKKAIKPLIEILRDSDKLSHRIHSLNALIEMEENPAPYLLELLDKKPPWYLLRNIVYILRKRKDPSGLQKFKELWKSSHIKVKLEIIYYLFSIKNKEWINYFKEAVESPIEEMVLLAARMITKIKWDEAIQIVMERAKDIPSYKIGSDFHRQLLYCLVRSGNKKAINYVSCVPINVKTFFPWQKNSLKKYINELLKDFKNDYKY